MKIYIIMTSIETTVVELTSIETTFAEQIFSGMAHLNDSNNDRTIIMTANICLYSS